MGDLTVTTDTAAVVDGLRSTFRSGRTKPLSWRMAQLRGLQALLAERGDELAAALRTDLGKSDTEAHLTEIGFVAEEVAHTVAHLRRWLRPRRVPVPVTLAPGRAAVVREPLGVVLVIAPWNYPVQLLLAPMVGALAAGNAVLAKPSELAPATSAVLTRLLPEYLDPRAVAVLEGGVPETTALLAQQFDHIFYTGNGAVGRVVMAAAAKHLTPVTLELGGKSPVYVDDTVDLRAAARRIAWGKFMNAGQTCVAPDYLLATPSVAHRLEGLLGEATTELYGSDPAGSADYGRIVNDRHFTRLTGLLGSGRVVFGGESVAAERYLAPTVLADVGLDTPVMGQEIFGPILPIVTVSGLGEAIDVINAGDRPLALYAFTDDTGAKRRLLRETSSGAVGFGVPSAHLMVPGLPFGGVGPSGMGAYHGERSLTTFSHEKAVLHKALRPDTLALVYPPFTAAKQAVIRKVVARVRG